MRKADSDNTVQEPADFPGSTVRPSLPIWLVPVGLGDAAGVLEASAPETEGPGLPPGVGDPDPVQAVRAEPERRNAATDMATRRRSVPLFEDVIAYSHNQPIPGTGRTQESYDI